MGPRGTVSLLLPTVHHGWPESCSPASAQGRHWTDHNHPFLQAWGARPLGSEGEGTQVTGQMGPGVSLTDLVSPHCECWHPAKQGELPSLGSWSVHPCASQQVLAGVRLSVLADDVGTVTWALSLYLCWLRLAQLLVLRFTRLVQRLPARFGGKGVSFFRGQQP